MDGAADLIQDEGTLPITGFHSPSQNDKGISFTYGPSGVDSTGGRRRIVGTGTATRLHCDTRRDGLEPLT